MFTEPKISSKIGPQDPNSGWFELIVGPMFSGKTEELIRRLKRAEIAGFRIEIFKPEMDNRYDKEFVVSHNRTKYRSTTVKSPNEIIDRKIEGEVIGLDELQFFDESSFDLVRLLTKQGKRVIGAALDKDYKGESFENVTRLMAEADFLTKLHAICVKCGSLASFTFRKANQNERILVGDHHKYEARCRKCFFNEDQGQ